MMYYDEDITLPEFFKLVEHASEDYDVSINDVDTILDILLCKEVVVLYKDNTGVDKCRYCVVIYVMQMITHLIWKYLYKYSPKLGSTPMKAIASNDEYAAMMRIELGLLIDDL